VNLNGNWVDLVIILILIFFVSEAWRVGFWYLLADFASFLGSLIISLRGYQFTAFFLRENFSLSHSIANALGFLATAILAETLLGFIFISAVAKLPREAWKHWANKTLSVLPALGEGLILVAFLLTLVIGFPINPAVKKDVAESRIGSFLLRETSGLEKSVNEIFGGVIEDSLTYLTIKPGSRESIPLTTGKAELSLDEASEKAMFGMVNEERRKVGVGELTWAPEIVPVSRAHARDMWERQYFSHVSPEGADVGDRLIAGGISFKIAGENLAMAPTLATAHNGLMNSEGHRRNILDPEFGKVGIGVIDNGIYGKMFVQVFTD